MRKIDGRVTAGTRVRLHGNSNWYTVESVHVTRKWFKVVELAGSFQRGHIVTFSNKNLCKIIANITQAPSWSRHFEFRVFLYSKKAGV